MANTIRIKRRSSAGATGAPSSLENAELAYNEADDTLYYGKGSGGVGGTATTIEAIAGVGAFVTKGTSQTITGAKTFSGTTIVPTPTENTHAATKLYVDTAVGAVATSFTVAGDTGTNQTITSGSDTLTIAGGTGIDTVGGATDKITINIDSTVAVKTDKLSVFAATSSSELAGVISDETGTGALVFGTSPAITTSLTTPSTSFDLLNTTATTINFGGAADINLGASNKTVTIAGNLVVNGTTTTINSTTVAIDDLNLQLGSATDTYTPSDAGANGGGITLKGTTDKTFNWIDATDSWTSSEHIDLVSGKVYKINGTEVLSSSTLGSGVTSSSLTSVGTITSGTWNGTTVASGYGGTGFSTYAAGDLIYASASNTLSKRTIGSEGQHLTVNASGMPVWSDLIDGGTF